MSAALVRQALEFVDEEESVDNRNKAARRRKGSSSQESRKLQKAQNKVDKKPQKQQLDKATIKKLLALSRPTVKKSVTEKIVQRAAKGRPLIEKIEVKRDEVKSILFAEDDPILLAEAE